MGQYVFVSYQGVSGMPYKDCRLKCQLCGDEQYRRNIDRHLYRAHQVGDWRPGFSAAPSRSTTNAPSPEREMDDLELSAPCPPVNNLTVVPVSVHQSMVPDVRDSSAMVNCQLDVPYGGINSVNLQVVPSVSVDYSANNALYQATPVLSDHRSVVSRAQLVSCVRESSDENAEFNHSAVLKPVVNGTTSISEDTLNN